MTRPFIPGQVVGTAGGSLHGASWVQNASVAKIGLEAERKTAQVLNRLIAAGISVLHDLRIPIYGFTANIDHVLVFGNNVLILDSKHWAGGFYWTAGGKTRRGMSEFAPADKKTLLMAQKHIERFLSSRGVAANVLTPGLVIWPKGPANFLLYRPQGGAHVIRGGNLARWVKRHTSPVNANINILGTLSELKN